MRVIENKMQEVETVCPHCHSRFAYNNSDVQDYEWESYLRCPCCDNLIHLQTPPLHPEGLYQEVQGIY